MQISLKMRSYHSFAHQESLRVLRLLVLATVLTSFVSNAQPIKCGPEIITYDDCTCGAGVQLPTHQIQNPLCPPLPPPLQPITCHKTLELKSHGYNIDGLVEDRHPPSSRGFQLPVSIEKPILPPSTDCSLLRQTIHDPLRGKCYGIGIQPAPVDTENIPLLGHYDFGVQTSIPAPAKPAPVGPLEPCSIPIGLQVQPCANLDHGSPLWGSLPPVLPPGDSYLSEIRPLAEGGYTGSELCSCG